MATSKTDRATYAIRAFVTGVPYGAPRSSSRCDGDYLYLRHVRAARRWTHTHSGADYLVVDYQPLNSLTPFLVDAYNELGNLLGIPQLVTKPYRKPGRPSYQEDYNPTVYTFRYGLAGCKEVKLDMRTYDITAAQPLRLVIRLPIAQPSIDFDLVAATAA